MAQDDGSEKLVPEDELPLDEIENPDGELIVQYQPGMTLDEPNQRYREVMEWNGSGSGMRTG